MKFDRYELKAGSNLTTFEFLSEGRKGKIVKVAQFQKMNIEIFTILHLVIKIWKQETLMIK